MDTCMPQFQFFLQIILQTSLLFPQLPFLTPNVLEQQVLLGEVILIIQMASLTTFMISIFFFTSLNEFVFDKA